MFRYENVGNVAMTVKLPNDYIIFAISSYNKEENFNQVDMYLKDDMTDMLDYMEDFEKLEFSSDAVNLKKDIASYITDAYYAGSFNKYFDRYSRTMECFTLGNDILEAENR